MTNPPTTPSSVSVETLTPVAYQGAPVITSALLAVLYGTSVENIHDNHRKNIDRFVSGKHFHKVTGAELRALKTDRIISGQFGIAMNARHLILTDVLGEEAE